MQKQTTAEPFTCEPEVQVNNIQNVYQLSSKEVLFHADAIIENMQHVQFLSYSVVLHVYERETGFTL